MMQSRTKRTVIWMAMALVSTLGPARAAAPNLYGRVLHTTPSGPAPLRDAIVRLFSADESEEQAKTYTDSSGNFAFYEIPEGTYELRIFVGTSLMRQESEGRLISSRPVEVSSRETTRVPDIVVVAEGSRVGAPAPSDAVPPPTTAPPGGPEREVPPGNEETELARELRATIARLRQQISQQQNQTRTIAQLQAKLAAQEEEIRRLQAEKCKDCQEPRPESIRIYDGRSTEPLEIPFGMLR